MLVEDSTQKSKSEQTPEQAKNFDKRKALTPVEAIQVYPELASSVGVLANWRCHGRGPRFYRKGLRRILYKPEDIEAFMFGRPVLTRDCVG
jgi:hypothetical protein